MKRLLKIFAVLGVLVIAIVVAGVAILKSLDFNEYRALIAEQVKSATGRDLEIKGDLNLQISLSPSVSVDGVTFANSEWGSRPAMVSLDSFAAEVSLIPLLSGDVQVKRIVLQGVDVLLETNSDGLPNWSFAPAESGDEEAAESDSGEAALPVVHTVQARDVTLTYKDGQTGDEQNIMLAVLELTADGADSPMNLLLETTYNQEDIKVTGSLGTIEALSGNKIFPLKLNINALGADITLDGTVNEPRRGKGLNIGFDIKSENVASLASRGIAMAGVDGAASLPSKPFSVSGALRDGNNEWSIDGFALKIGNSDLRGNTAVNLSGKRPNISADLSSTLFDLSDVMVEQQDSAATGETGTGESPDDGRIFPNEPLPLDGLKSIDAEVAFTGKTVNAKGVSLGDVDVELTLKNGRLVVSPFGLTFGDGRIGGDISLDGSSPKAKLSVAIDGKQIDYGQILKDMAGEESLTGKMDMKVQVRGTGSSVRALMAGLDGTVRVASQDGYIDSGALAFVTGPLMALFEGEDAKTLRCAVADFNIIKGQATSKATIFETGGLSIVGEGGIDLAEEKLALYFDPRAKNTSFASAAEIGINVGGTLKEPSIGPDVGDVAMEAAGIAAGVATGGLSTIIGMAADGMVSGVDDTDYCALALAGKPLKSDESASGGGSEGTSTTEPATQEQGGGIGGVIEGIFGN